ncbi:DegV family protein [Desulfobacterales bacterium HSG2]|nr:DegV family protein [Desulfobacterales bacterium HSG2]
MERKVFIIDDDAIMGSLLQSQLSESGFEAEYFNNGEDALAKVFQAGPAELSNLLVIADLVMSPISGKELCGRLRQKPETAGIPFIFLMTGDDSSEQSDALRTKADDYIFKPFRMEDLLERITKVMEYAAKVRYFRSRTDFDGDLGQVGLSDFVQIAELNQKSGELVLKRPGGETVGKVFFSKGSLTASESGELEGEEAFYNLLCEEEGAFEFFGREIDVPEQITADNTAILIRANLLLDQSRRLSDKLPDDNLLLRLGSRKIPPELEERTGKEHLRKILSMIHARKSASEIISGGEMSRLRSRAVLADLLDAGIIEISSAESAVRSGDPGRKQNLIGKELISLLEDAERRSMTGVLKTECRQTKGAIYVQDGCVVHAYYGGVIGKKALYRIFSEKAGVFSFQSRPVIIRETINEPLSLLTEEGNREIEALRRLSAGSYESVVALNQRGLERVSDIRNRPGLVYVLSLVQQYGRVRDIIDASQMTDLQTYKHLLYLVQKEMLVIESGKGAGIRLVTDSSADLPPDIIRDLNITLVPLSVEIGRQTFRDGVDLTPEDFYRAMKSSDSLRISPPDVDEFHRLFRDIVSTEDIFAIFLSGKMSRMYDRATTAKRKFSDDYLKQRQDRGEENAPRLDIVDSGLISLGTGLLVAEAADKIRKGMSAEEIHRHIESLIPCVRLFFVADTPAYLYKSGRVGKARALFGSLLGMKPILAMGNGEIATIDYTRGSKNALGLVLRLMVESMGDDSETPIMAGVMHAAAPDLAARMRRLLDSRLNCRNIIMSEMGPAVGSVCGPGALGIAYFPLQDDK